MVQPVPFRSHSPLLHGTASTIQVSQSSSPWYSQYHSGLTVLSSMVQPVPFRSHSPLLHGTASTIQVSQSSPPWYSQYHSGLTVLSSMVQPVPFRSHSPLLHGTTSTKNSSCIPQCTTPQVTQCLLTPSNFITLKRTWPLHRRSHLILGGALSHSRACDLQALNLVYECNT